MNEPPIRLLESSDLTSAERALLDAGRSVVPVHYDALVGAAKLQATLASLPGSAVATTTAAKTLTAIKLSVLVIPMLGAAAYYATRANPEVTSVSAEPSALEVVPSVDAPVVTPTRSDAAARDVSADAPDSPRAPRRTPVARPASILSTPSVRAGVPASTPRTRSRTAVEAPTPSQAHVVATPSPVQPPTEVEAPPVPEAPQEATTEEAPQEAVVAPAPVSESINELRGIAQARALLERDPGTALSLLQRLGREHPKGYFVEERLALTVIALARTGAADPARAQAIRFLRSYPKSPFADRVRAAVQ